MSGLVREMLKLEIYIKAAVPALLFLVSCSREHTDVFVPVPLAETAVSDTSSVWHKALSCAGKPSGEGGIAVFGGFAETAVLTERLLSADMFDNIDGKPGQDGLADFAGETVMPVFDMVNAPYSGYFDRMNEDYIREVAVKGFLASVSDRCSSSVFDRSLSAPKPSAKLVLLSSSILAGYGSRDIGYLVEASGIGTGVLTTVHSSVSSIFSKASQSSNIGVWASQDIVSSGVYGSVFNSIRAEYADRKSPEYRDWAETSEIVCLSTEASGTPEERVRAFLGSYIDAEYDTPLSGVIADDLELASSVDSLNAAVDSIMASGAAADLRYKAVMAPGFRFVSPAECIVADSYRWMRKNDRFTHLIAAPMVKGYMTVTSPDVQTRSLDSDGMLPDEIKYGRAQDSGIETFCFMPVGPGCLGDRALERLEALAPETYKGLVYVY